METTHPASANWVSRPSLFASIQIRWVAGMTMQRTPGATFRPFITSAAMRRSPRRPFVQEPITTWSMSIGSMASTVCVFSGRCGKATVGLSAPRSISMVRS